MRHTIYIMLTAVLGVMMDSCGYSSRTSRVLDSAESVMAVSPDSAYRILSSLPDPFPGDGGQYARYALLRTESEYKSGMCPSSDTLISVAVDYYSRRDPGSADCMRSYYYQGRVRIYAENYGDAIVSLLNSERAARRHSDHLMLGLIYRGIADSYNSLVDDGSAHEYYRLSYEEFCKAPENIYTDYALCDLARSSNNAFRYEEGLDAAKKLYGIAIKKQDIDLICGSLGCLGRSYAGLERYDSARTAFMELSEYPYPYVSVKDWIEIGLCHIRDNELDKAISVNDSIKKYRPSEHSLLYFIYKSQKKYSDANPLLIEEMELQNDEIKRFVLRNFSHVVRNYYNLQLDKTTAVLEKQ
ncbi:MAG: hypothetical protein K2O12_06240, partial [Muribaculaceae bacterium]|nr:hypothetical protein [Muribaculaceae bacterium]